MSKDQEALMERFLGAVFLSLGRCVELSFLNGDQAVGVFGGIDYPTGKVLVHNFCFSGSDTSEAKKIVSLKELRFFSVRQTLEESTSSHKQPQLAAQPKDTQNSLGSDWKTIRPKNSQAAFENGDSGKYSLKDKPKGIKNDVFRTDTEISKKTHDSRQSGVKGAPTGQKVFKKFTIDQSLKGELLEGLNGTIGEFDQFKANQNHFGIKSEFDENEYTTHLDMRKISKMEAERADRLAREIEAADSSEVMKSRHWQEERNLIKLKDNDEDEEALYSAVVREEKTEEAQKKTEVKKVKLRLKEAKTERKDGFRAAVEKSFAAVKREVKEGQTAATGKDSLMSTLSATASVVNPLPPVTAVPDYYPQTQQPQMYYQAQPNMYGQTAVYMAYQPGGQYYSPQMMYPGYQMPPGMYAQQPNYQPPR